MHINNKTLLPKTNELYCCIAKSSNSAVIGVTGTILDSTAYDSEETVDNSKIIQNDRSRKGWVVACCIRNNVCYNRKDCISGNIEIEFTNLLFLKPNPILVGIIKKTPSKTQF